MSDEKMDEKKLPADATPVVHVEPGKAVPKVDPDDPSVFHPRKHRAGISVGVPDVPNLAPGGDVEIKR